MLLAIAILNLSSLVPLLVALHANRRASLLHAVLWMYGAWFLWAIVLFGRASDWTAATELRVRYLALVLTGCAGIAVLGARRPGVAAWNFVVLGLLVVLCLPLAQGWLLGTPLQLGELYQLCLGGTLAITVLNYLPTRFLLSAALLGSVCTWEFATLRSGQEPARPVLTGLALTALPWLGWATIRSGKPGQCAAETLWFTFRDRYGFLWAQRVREQFNNSMHHAGQPVRLQWAALDPQPASAAESEQAAATLRALLKRFLDPRITDS